MNKNDIITIDIIDVTEDGNGVGKYNGDVIFVPHTAVGDFVSVKIIKVLKNYSIGKIVDIISPSSDRIVPDCECFFKCGGCVYRHINYEAELKLKEKRVSDCVNRIAKIDIAPCRIVSDGNINRYRNKSQLPVGSNGEIGFYANHSHRIIECQDCLLQPEIFNKEISALKKYINISGASCYDSEIGNGLIRHLFLRCSKDCKQIMIVLVINGDTIPQTELFVSLSKEAFGDSLKSVVLNINKRNNNVILGDKNITVYGAEYIEDEICGIKVRLSPNSFYQVNREMAELLYRKAGGYANTSGKTVLDLYCGTGTIGLSMANEAKNIIGVEIVEEAVNDAKLNAKANGITNAEFICADAFKAVLELKKRKLKPDVVILDPPRKGCDSEVIETVTEDFSPERIVYVSCNPATLARDLNIFKDNGYILSEYTPFDLFPRTAHVETVSLLIKSII